MIKTVDMKPLVESIARLQADTPLPLAALAGRGAMAEARRRPDPVLVLGCEANLCGLVKLAELK